MSTVFSSTTEVESRIEIQTEKEASEKEFIQNRVFINHVDTYHGKNIASYLTDQVHGAMAARGGAGEGEEEEDEGEEGKTVKTAIMEGLGEKYQVVGTLQEKFHKPSEDILEVVDDVDEAEFKSQILKCGYVVFDITNDEGEIAKALIALNVMVEELDRILAIGPKTYENYPDVRTFILISTVMTWGLTKPIDPEEPDTPFTEADYRKRRAHPNYKLHIACEREIIMRGKKYKDKLKTYIICSGITYGLNEDKLTFYFKLAWNNETNLPIFKNGNNFVPLIHVKDLAKVIHGVCEKVPNKPQYILAVEQTPCKFRQVVKALSKAMGRGRTKEVSQEEAFLYNGIDQQSFEMCTVNLNMEPSYIVEDLAIEWQSELNFAENMNNMVTEFRTSRNLKPLRVVLHGPAASGKTMIAKRICDYYGPHYISVKSMIKEKIESLKDTIKLEKQRLEDKEAKEQAKAERAQFEEDEVAEEEEEEEDYGDVEELEEQLRDLDNTLNFSETGRLPDEYVIRLMKDLLRSNICQNQGYVLDGYPKTLVQAKELFSQAGEAGGEEAAEEEGGDEAVGTAAKVLPDYVISLEASDDFLCNRIMEKPESEIQGTHYDEEGMLRRLAEFRANNTEDNTLLNFFDEMEIHPKVINVMEYPPDDVEPIMDIAFGMLGPPVLFEPTVEEEREAHKLAEEKSKLEEEEQMLSKEIAEKQAADQYYRKMEEWTRLLENLQMEEEKLLVAQSEPLRHYLMKFVFPTLTRGLVETARLKPQDPVDFLAEFLFKENPEGKMFDPSYTQEGLLTEQEQQALMDEMEQKTEQLNDDLQRANPQRSSSLLGPF